MTDRPPVLRLLDLRSRAVRLAHAAAADLYRELAEVGSDDDHVRALLRESAALALERMPALTRPLRGLELEWEEQDLLDPIAAERTGQRLQVEVVEIMPAVVRLRARQNEIVSEICALVVDARSRPR
jgi:hypothetical protein